eukprot:3832802-Rhodomonas_salina.1
MLSAAGVEGLFQNAAERSRKIDKTMEQKDGEAGLGANRHARERKQQQLNLTSMMPGSSLASTRA